MIKNLFLRLILLFFFVLAIPTLVVAKNHQTDEIKKAAREGINNLVKNQRFDDHYRNQGFENQADLDSAELGEGFQIYTIDPGKLLNETEVQDFETIAIPTGEWGFLILNNKNEATSILYVSFFNGKWTYVGIGSSVLAKEMSGFLKTWPASSGYTFRLIRVYQASSTYLELHQGDKIIGIIPLSQLIMTPSRPVGKFSYNDLRKSKDVLLELRPAVKHHIETWRNLLKQ